MNDLFSIAPPAAPMARAMGGHQSAKAGTTSWLTPPDVLEALGGWESFELDPCAAPAPQPWRTARHMNAEADGDGLLLEWFGRVLLNPPYTSADLAKWLGKMGDHNNGTAIIFARTETEAFHRHVWQRASGLLFLEGRLHFHRPDGTRAKENAGAPTVLCAYGAEDMDRLAASALAGAFVPLRLARMVLVAGMDQSWSEAVRGWIARQRGPVSVSDAYRYFASHPKAAANANWRAKVRQKLAQVAERIERDSYVACAA
jgi:hypothetical protein